MGQKGKTGVNKSLVSSSRRKTVQSVSLAGVIAATGASGISEWVKPLVQIVALPAHAACTQACPELLLELSEFDNAPPGGGNAHFLVTLSALGCTLVFVEASVDNGGLLGPAAGEIGDGASLQFVWRGPGEPGQAVPLDPTILSVSWRCSDRESGVERYDLRAMAGVKNGGGQEM